MEKGKEATRGTKGKNRILERNGAEQGRILYRIVYRKKHLRRYVDNVKEKEG